MRVRPFNRRERLVVVAGVTIALIAIAATLFVVPFYRTWSDREAQISASQERLARIRGLIRQQNALSRTAGGMESSSTLSGRLISARTLPLAASDLQRVMRMYAERSRISIDRLEFFQSEDSSALSGSEIPLTISAVGDIYGISDFLNALRSGSPVVEIREMNLISNSALKDGLIQFSATLRAPVVLQ